MEDSFNELLRKVNIDTAAYHDHSEKFQRGDGPNATPFDEDDERSFVQWNTLPLVLGKTKQFSIGPTVQLSLACGFR